MVSIPFSCAHLTGMKAFTASRLPPHSPRRGRAPIDKRWRKPNEGTVLGTVHLAGEAQHRKRLTSFSTIWKLYPRGHYFLL